MSWHSADPAVNGVDIASSRGDLVQSPLEEQEIRVYSTSLNLDALDLDWLTQVILPEEWSKARRFRYQLHQQRFLAARAILRLLLAAQLGCDPRQIALRLNPFGKPFIAGAPLQFNLSHCNEQLLIAVSRQSVGIDLEETRPLENLELVAQNIFSSCELKVWHQLPVERRVPAFFRIWARKEALLKGIGCGLDDYIQQTTVLLKNEDSLKIPELLTREPWRVYNLELPTAPTYAAAVASPMPSPVVTFISPALLHLFQE